MKPLYVAEVWVTPAHECNFVTEGQCPICEDLDRCISKTEEFPTEEAAFAWALTAWDKNAPWARSANIRVFLSGLEDDPNDAGDIVWDR